MKKKTTARYMNAKKIWVFMVIGLIAVTVSSCILPPSHALKKAIEKAEKEENTWEVKIHINHVGYETSGPKWAVVETRVPLSSFEIVEITGNKSVLSGKLEKVDFTEWDRNSQFFKVDFTEVKKAGTYRIRSGDFDSEVIVVGNRILLDKTFDSVLSYFRESRADHPEVLKADSKAPVHGSRDRRDVRGGWYDASGDISKYLSHLSFANYMNPQQIPLTAWALAWVFDTAGSEKLLNAETLNKVAEEALWGADYLVRVMHEDGYFFLNVFDKWSGDLGMRTLCSFRGKDGTISSDYQAAYREGGGMSIAALARISTLGKNGDFESAKYLERAIVAFDHLQHYNHTYADNGKENIIDDYAALMAASELFAATKEEKYLSIARARMESLESRLTPEGYFMANDKVRPFWHASDAGLPIVTLARYMEVETDDPMSSRAAAVIQTHLDYLLKVTGNVPNPYGYARQTIHYRGKIKDSFFIPHQNETNYWWQGEDARLGSLATAAYIGGKKLKSLELADDAALVPLRKYATDQLNWILGSNHYDNCMLNGFGRDNPPDYGREKYEHGTLKGGIANGITGSTADGQGIAWFTDPPADAAGWDRWRWIEQWLPHSTWYMMAIIAAEL